MEIDPIQVNLTCLFCDAPLSGKKDAVLNSGDLIPCGNCGEGNDYDSVLSIAREKALAEAKTAINSELKKIFKKR